jgi:hypothetical protein
MRVNPPSSIGCSCHFPGWTRRGVRAPICCRRDLHGPTHINHVAHVRTAQWLRDTTASPYFVPNLLAFDLLQPYFIEIQGIPELAVCETPFWGTRPLRITLGVGLLLTGR